MSIFSKDQEKNTSRKEPEMTEEETRIAAIESFADNALDTLAGMLREYGRFGFDIEVMEAEDLRRHCDTWARHILTGTPPPSDRQDREDSEQPKSIALHQRHLPSLLQFFRNHRRNEQAAVFNSAKGMTGLIRDMTQGLRIANRLLEAIRSLNIDYEGTNIQVTASIGMSAFRPEDTAEMLIKRTDEALYQAKQDGRNRVVVAPTKPFQELPYLQRSFQCTP